jgi:ribosomal 50S subunit-recycling heat shock protein
MSKRHGAPPPAPHDDDEAPAGKVRLDKWLWAARFFKTRAMAAEAIDGGKVDVNGDRAKRAKLVQAGDHVRLRNGPIEWQLQVTDIAERRGSAEIAQGLYTESACKSSCARCRRRLRMARASPASTIVVRFVD